MNNEQKLNYVYEFIQSLQSSAQIPLGVDQAFRDRFIKQILGASSKTAASETTTQAVNEAGSGSYSISAAKPMDGFKEFNAGGTVIYIPYYT